ncbi:flagellar filament capping protein FliD [Nocardioides sp. SYSU DS0663]|uniref:flagellar filament capping protein FliD n=1 Tax=Nocardioides sp. SYSU DS0663 TaxID=3416445 RepID=UPI003F4B7C7A
MASVSGLTGFDAGGLVEQLMQLEQAPQKRLQTRVGNEQLRVNSLQTLNTRVASLFTKAESAGDLAKWGGWTATSTSDKVSVTAGPTASATSLSITVNRTATTHQLGFADTAAPGDVVVAGTTAAREVVLTTGGVAKTVAVGGGTLQELADALNDPDNATGVRASLVSTTGGHRLLVESASTGAASAFTLTNADGTDLLGGATVRAGQDAELALGAGITVTSATNTFTELLPGVNLTVAPGTAGGTTSTVTVARDEAAATKLVKDLVDGLNSVLGEMKSLTAYGANGAGKGMLAGDSVVRSAQQALRGTIFGDDGVSLATLGIQIDRTGTFTLDEAAFKKAYATDPTGVAEQFTSGFATRVKEAADGASNKDTGTLTTALTGRKNGIERLNDSIEAWDRRLELRRTALSRQFTALETALSRMSSQSNWLAGQLSSLSSYRA